MKLFCYDIESTGLNPGKHSIHQIAGIILIDGKEKERFEINMKPNPKAVIDPAALAVSNKTEEDVMNNPLSFQEGYQEVVRIASKYVSKFDKKDKFFTLGYNNASFDDNFLRGLFLQNGDNYYGSFFWADSLDVRTLAIRQLAPIRHEMENFKLMTVARQMGIEIDESKLHDAVYDCEITYEVYKRLRLTKQELESSIHDFEFKTKVKDVIIRCISNLDDFIENQNGNIVLPASIMEVSHELETLKTELVHE
jgi:DNA polymerase III subunit epsilon